MHYIELFINSTIEPSFPRSVGQEPSLFSELPDTRLLTPDQSRGQVAGMTII